MADRRRRRLAVATLAAVLLSGCSAAPGEPVPTPTTVDLSTYDPAEHGNGVALLAPAQARDAVLAAMRSAGGAEVTGIYRDAASGRDLQVRRTGDTRSWTADITIDGAATSLVVAEGEAWVNPSPGVASLLGTVAGEWACVSPEDPAVQRWAPLLQPVDLVADLTTDAAGLSAPADGTVDLLLGEDGAAGVLTVTTTGRPLPVRLVRADDTGTVDLAFTDWGADPDLTPPASC